MEDDTTTFKRLIGKHLEKISLLIRKKDTEISKLSFNE